MANFNLPFGVFVSKPLVLDASRYVVKNIAERDALIPKRAYDGLQTYVKDNSTLYILKDVSNSIWGIIPDLSTIVTSDASKLNNYTDTFYGDLTVDGSIVISGNIIQDGSYYVTNVEEITSKNEFITLREGSITALNDGSISGIRILKADGSANVILGASNDAVMRVGWEEEDLLAIATREDNPTNLGYAYWDDASSMFKTDLLAETVSRTIYVETTGSDETGDGTSVGTAYATIGKAISTIKKNMVSGVEITIQIGKGTFNMGLSDFTLLSVISGNVVIKGTMTLVNSGFTIGAADASDPMTFNISGSDSSSWVTNQWQQYFANSLDYRLYVPITANTAGPTPTLSIAGVVMGAEIYRQDTSINLTFPVGGTAYIIGNNLNLLSFEEIKLVFPSCGISFEKTIAEVSFKVCTLISGSASNYFYLHAQSRIYSSIFYNWRIAGNTPPDSFIGNYCYLNSNSNVIQMWGSNDNSFIPSFRNIVLENPNTSSSSNCIYFSSKRKYWTDAATTPTYIKFINSNVAVKHAGDECIFILNKLGSSKIILKNTNYLVRYSSANDTTAAFKFYLNYSDIIGSPVIRWFYNSMIEFINSNSGRNVQIKGLLYPEVEVNQTKNLSNNTTTPIIIGDVSQNISCKVDYTIKRGSGFRSGNFNIISDVSNSYISTDVFSTNYDSTVDASAISFSTYISNGKYIMMNVTQNNSTDASLFYNVSRVMRTPISI